MSVVIRGSGSVMGPLWTCQSFSASIRFPRSERSRKIPLQDEQVLTVTPPRVRVVIADSHLGQVISSMHSKILPAPGISVTNARAAVRSASPDEYERGCAMPRFTASIDPCR